MPRVSPATAGGHFNPAVSCAVFFSARDNSFTGRKAALYSVVQVLSGSWCGRVACNVILPSFVQHSLRTFRSWSWIDCKLVEVAARFGKMPLPDLARCWKSGITAALIAVGVFGKPMPAFGPKTGYFLTQARWVDLGDSRFRWISQLRVFFFGKALLGELIFTFTLSYVVLCVAVSSITKAGSPTTSCIWQDAWRSICQTDRNCIQVWLILGNGCPPVHRHVFFKTGFTSNVKDAYSSGGHDSWTASHHSTSLSIQSYPGNSLLRTCNRLLCCCWWLRYGQCFWRIFESSSASEQKWEGKSVCCTGHCMAIINQTSCWKCVILIVLTVLAIFD